MNRQMFRVSFSIIISGLVLTNLAWANSPKIDIVFSDPAGICKDSENKTQFAFNYSYQTDKDFEYFSGPVYVSSSFQSISAPLPLRKNLSILHLKSQIWECVVSGILIMPILEIVIK